jgi:hypothetical protein
MRARLSRILARAALVVAGLAIGVLLSEGLLRLMAPDSTFGAATELPWMRERGADSPFMISPEMGFRPKLGTGLYSQWGTLPNDYAFEPSSERVRLLFIGDSVTARGRLVEALRRAEGDAGHEYWNAGVESFNTVQEVAFYRRFNAAILPDHVIVTFHLNDFQSTPVALRGDDGELVVYSPRQPTSSFNARLFAASHLYRAWVALRAPGGDPNAIAREVRGALSSLASQLESEGRCLSVIVFPFMERPEKWAPNQRIRHRLIMQMLDADGIRHFDLLPSLRRALAAGIDPQERPGDTWHPSAAVAEVFAADLLEAGLLAPDCLQPASEEGS